MDCCEFEIEFEEHFAKVAYTGDYNDLANKPSAGEHIEIDGNNVISAIGLATPEEVNYKIAAERQWTIGKLNEKVDKEEGKGLSSNDFTDEDKEMIAELATKVGKVADDVKKVDEDVKKVADDVEKVADDVKKVDEDVRKVAEDVEELAAEVEKKAQNVHLFCDGSDIYYFDDQTTPLTFEQVKAIIADDANSVFITNGYYSLHNKYWYRPDIIGTDKEAVGFIGECMLDGEVYTWRIIINEDNEVKEDEIWMQKHLRTGNGIKIENGVISLDLPDGDTEAY